MDELVQIDGSPHRWFEDRANPCTRIVFIDDARQYQVYTRGGGYTLHKAAITVCEAFDGTVTLLYKGRSAWVPPAAARRATDALGG